MGKFDGIFFISDLDGTLLNQNNQVSPQNKQAIIRFISGGGMFTIATGRTKMMAGFAIRNTPLNMPAILFNGAVLYDFSKDKLLSVSYMQECAVHMVLDTLSLFEEIGIEIYTMDKIYAVNYAKISREFFAFAGEPFFLADINNIPHTGWIKILLIQKYECLQKAYQFLQGKYGQKFHMVFSSSMFLEIFHKGISKGQALSTLINQYNVNRSMVYVIGDAMNDIEMIKCAAFSFVPENAMPEITRMASARVHSCNHHAVAAAIAHIELHR